MKMLKQKVSLKKINTIPAVFRLVTIFILASIALSPLVQADQYDDQIRALQAQNNVNQDQANAIQVVINSYQDKINALQSSISALQAKITANQNQRDALASQIAQAEADLANQKAVLADNLRAIYLDSQSSTLEVLAASQDLNQFLDLQQYRSAIQDKVKATVDKINALKDQLVANKTEVERLIADDEKVRGDLTSQQNEQYSLQNLSQSEKNSYDAKIRDNNSSINTLRAQQAAALRALTGNNGRSAVGSPIVYKNMSAQQWCGGGYRYCGYSLDSYVFDDWGLGLTRECVHYVADTLDRRGYYIPYGLFAGRGNANRWVGTTSGGTADLVFSPQVDDVVYLPIAPLGHVAIVDEVYGDGWIKVSQMNWGPGMYSTMDLQITPNLQFLRFHK